ncbi:hypothetical protein [Paraburkholderia caballeronis]|uniref:hypothetical protein n=1 Tax=Paraburkholderia caballeronis TaxID=416943 RepID=UPI001FCA8763|nr:hypothetical protein [Paraburkholderia caballeronis]
MPIPARRAGFAPASAVHRAAFSSIARSVAATFSDVGVRGGSSFDAAAGRENAGALLLPAATGEALDDCACAGACGLRGVQTYGRGGLTVRAAGAAAAARAAVLPATGGGPPRPRAVAPNGCAWPADPEGVAKPCWATTAAAATADDDACSGGRTTPAAGTGGTLRAEVAVRHDSALSMPAGMRRAAEVVERARASAAAAPLPCDVADERDPEGVLRSHSAGATGSVRVHSPDASEGAGGFGIAAGGDITGSDARAGAAIPAPAGSAMRDERSGIAPPGSAVRDGIDKADSPARPATDEPLNFGSARDTAGPAANPPAGVAPCAVPAAAIAPAAEPPPAAVPRCTVVVAGGRHTVGRVQRSPRRGCAPFVADSVVCGSGVSAACARRLRRSSRGVSSSPRPGPMPSPSPSDRSAQASTPRQRKSSSHGSAATNSTAIATGAAMCPASFASPPATRCPNALTPAMSISAASSAQLATSTPTKPSHNRIVPGPRSPAPPGSTDLTSRQTRGRNQTADAPNQPRTTVCMPEIKDQKGLRPAECNR